MVKLVEFCNGEAPPPIPKTIATYDPEIDPLHVRTEELVLFKTTRVGLRLQVREGRESPTVRLTLLVYPPRLTRFIVEDPVELTLKLTMEGFEVMTKPCVLILVTCTLSVVE